MPGEACLGLPLEPGGVAPPAGGVGLAVGVGVALVPVDGDPCAGGLGLTVGVGVAMVPVDGDPGAGDVTAGVEGNPGHLPQVIWQ